MSNSALRTLLGPPQLRAEDIPQGKALQQRVQGATLGTLVQVEADVQRLQRQPMKAGVGERLAKVVDAVKSELRLRESSGTNAVFAGEARFGPAIGSVPGFLMLRTATAERPWRLAPHFTISGSLSTREGRPVMGEARLRVAGVRVAGAILPCVAVEAATVFSVDLGPGPVVKPPTIKVGDYADLQPAQHAVIHLELVSLSSPLAFDHGHLVVAWPGVSW